MRDAWREFRKMRWWGQVLVGGATIFVILVIFGAIFGEEASDNSNDTKAQEQEVTEAAKGEDAQPQPCSTPLTITTPHDGSTVHSASIRIRGRSAPNVRVTVRKGLNADTFTARKTGRFAANASLTLGDNDIAVTAVRSGCDAANESVNLRYKRSAAQLAAIRQRKQEEKARKAAARQQYEANYKAAAKNVPFKELDKNPYEHEGEKVVYKGQIFQIQEEFGTSVILLSVTSEGYGYWSDEIWVDYKGEIDSTDEDIITVYGRITGEKEYEAQIGTRTVPRMRAKYIEE